MINFFNNKEFAAHICEEAIIQNICAETETYLFEFVSKG